jgi:hypothetical protein
MEKTYANILIKANKINIKKIRNFRQKDCMRKDKTLSEERQRIF